MSPSPMSVTKQLKLSQVIGLRSQQLINVDEFNVFAGKKLN